MIHLSAIDIGLAAKKSYGEIARKIYLTYPTKAFIGHEEQQYEVLNEISLFFGIAITGIQVAGSAKTGRSFHKQQDFTPGTSDLDIAIVDSRLFIKYMEFVLKESKGYSDLTKFPVRNGISTHDEYTRYISRGIFRPDLMTIGPVRAEWNNFFGTLSTQHTNLFKSINSSIYLSQNFFESKQRSAIKNYTQYKAL
jgi:hypothetical protein